MTAARTRDALATALLCAKHPDNPDAPFPMVRAGAAGVLADALLASGAVQTLPDAIRALAKDQGARLAILSTPNAGRGLLDLADYIETKLEQPSSDELMAEGRRLASERENLIAQGVDPADLAVPLAPDEETA